MRTNLKRSKNAEGCVKAHAFANGREERRLLAGEEELHFYVTCLVGGAGY